MNKTSFIIHALPPSSTDRLSLCQDIGEYILVGRKPPRVYRGFKTGNERKRGGKKRYKCPVPSRSFRPTTQKEKNKRGNNKKEVEKRRRSRRRTRKEEEVDDAEEERRRSRKINREEDTKETETSTIPRRTQKKERGKTQANKNEESNSNKNSRHWFHSTPRSGSVTVIKLCSSHSQFVAQPW